MDFKYRVVTEVASVEGLKKTLRGEDILFETNNFLKARKECIEWAAWDDIFVRVTNRYGAEKFTCDGSYEAETRYPKTVAAM